MQLEVIPRARLASPADIDLCRNMDLVVQEPQLATSQRLAEGLAGPFAALCDGVASAHYSAPSSIDTADFERSAGPRLLAQRPEPRSVGHGCRSLLC